MIKRKLSAPDYLIVAANLLPVFGVWELGWDAKEVFLVYCLETVIIGIMTLIKLAIATAVRKEDWWENGGSRSMVHGIFFMIFFIMHFGLFAGIQTSIFLGIGHLRDNASPGIVAFFSQPWNFIHRDGLLMLACFVVCYGFQNLFDFVLNRAYQTKSFSTIMFEPYLRIFIQQFTVIFGSMILSFGGGKIFILVFAVVKIFFSVGLDYECALNKERTNRLVDQQ